MKLIFTILIVYFAYKILFNTKKINPPQDNDNSVGKDTQAEDFADYEELD